MNGHRGRQRAFALLGSLAALVPAGAAWSQSAPPYAHGCGGDKAGHRNAGVVLSVAE